MNQRIALLGWLALWWTGGAACLVHSSRSLAADDAPASKKATPQQVAYFESKVRPLLLKHCASCHGEDTQESKLRLDTPAGILQGGASGPTVQPGSPGGSLLLTAVKQRGNLKMPPEDKLSTAEIQILEQWIVAGATLPEVGPIQPRRSAIDWESAGDHWAFQPLQEAELPQVSRGGWASGIVDLFLLAEMESRGLTPSSPANPNVLARRVALDLTGLPPTEQQLTQFLADPSPQAYAALVDSLLASPAYGERWGRHWLDVARYADSNGLDENIAHGNAWRYRDYVVGAFNRDLPFDAFVQQQIAGDLLPHDNPLQQRRQLIATGYLTLGPKVLAEVDEAKMEMDIIDEQIDTLGSSMLGLTLGCARCHDHKFDPVDQKDYYGLAGIFKSTRTMEHFTKIARWNEVSLPKTASEQRQADVLQSELESLEADLKRWQALAQQPAPAAGESQEDPKAKVKELTATIKKAKERLASFASAMAVGEREPTNLQVHVRGSHLTLGEEAPRRFLQVLQGDDAPLATDGSGRLELAKWLTNDQRHLLARVFANRVWRWHWGRGLCATVDNFGVLGERPSHPALLDHLASELIRNDWSVKQLQRTIVLSSAYQQDSRHREDASSSDPECQWYWRFTPRRLEAEAIRDAMLQAAGSLDRSMGGSLLHVGNREFFFDHTSKDGTRYDKTVRSLYLPVVRNNLFDGFMLFDYSDASTMQGDRAASVTAPQALYLLNSDLVDQAAAALADRTSQLGDAKRIGAMFQAALSRPPTEAERAATLRFMSQYGERADSRRSWQALAHSLLASNEFLYLR